MANSRRNWDWEASEGLRDERSWSRLDLGGVDSNLVSSSSLGTDTQSPPVEVLENVFWWSPETSAFSSARRASRFATDEEVGASSCESSAIMIEGRSWSTEKSLACQFGHIFLPQPREIYMWEVEARIITYICCLSCPLTTARSSPSLGSRRTLYPQNPVHSQRPRLYLESSCVCLLRRVAVHGIWKHPEARPARVVSRLATVGRYCSPQRLLLGSKPQNLQEVSYRQ